jgi:hypothetical protein
MIPTSIAPIELSLRHVCHFPWALPSPAAAPQAVERAQDREIFTAP